MSIRLPLTLLASALLLTGCDREADQPAQQQAELGGDKQALSGEIDRSQAGTLMPAVALVDPDGKKLNLAALQGEPVLLNLWATWCAPCVVEMPMLDDLAGQMDGNLRVITASQDLQGAQKVTPFFEQQDFKHLEPWMDLENELGLNLAGGVLPMTILYDASGKEVFRVAGGYEWDSEEAHAQIKEALAE